ncbi:MAG TPA: citrate transporter [Candidatus Avisuccinivibrio pullicola]|nr:citrate transporter [Candidatus Avisuccinivibrio pullicola]
MRKLLLALPVLAALSLPQTVLAEELFTRVTFYGIRYEMIIFALMLVGIAVFYNSTRQVALLGLVALCFFKYEFTDGFSVVTKLFGYAGENGEWVKGSWNTYFNLILMLPGFAILADIFEHSRFPALLPKYLPSDMRAGMLLLFFVFILSSFLDNIAAALIGCSLAAAVFGGKVHIGYAAAICAASNAGGAGSVVGDTTTTLIWIYGKDPLVIAQAFLPAAVATVIVAFFAARAQQRYAPALPTAADDIRVDKKALASVFLILICAILFNYFLEMPGVGIWLAILVSFFFTKVRIGVVKTAYDSTVFLVALVFCAELVPIESVPDASILSTLVIGFVSAVFNNIPLTQLCLIKGGYDWPLISYAVGFGGSMIWFGSSAGVAVCGVFTKARSFMNWLRYGWYIPFAFVVGFAVYLLVLGWDPVKGNPPDQIPEPVPFSQSIGNAPLSHN